MIKIDRKAIYTFARESFARLMNEKENPDTMLYYSKGFEAGFKQAQEFERFAMEMAKTPVKFHVDLDKMRELEKDFEKAQFGSPINDISFNMARKIERKMFEVMLESKSSKVFVVDFGPKYDGNIAKWDVEITCDEDKARRIAGNEGINYREIDFGHLIGMNDDEFERLLMDGVSRGDRNENVVRKWRDLMKLQTKETK